VSTTQGELGAKFATAVSFIPVANFAASVTDTHGNLPPVANLPPVSLTPVVHLDLQFSPRIVKKFEMILMLLSGAWGKVIHDKKT
jgi:hypothetical protein